MTLTLPPCGKTRSQINDRIRHLKRQYHLSVITWFHICLFYKNECVRCHEKLDWYHLSVDHILSPALNGEKADPKNLQPLCNYPYGNNCNRKKGQQVVDYRYDEGQELIKYLSGDVPIQLVFFDEQDFYIQLPLFEAIE